MARMHFTPYFDTGNMGHLIGGDDAVDAYWAYGWHCTKGVPPRFLIVRVQQLVSH